MHPHRQQAPQSVQAAHAATRLPIFHSEIVSNDSHPLGPFPVRRVAEQFTAEGPADVLGDLNGAQAMLGKTESQQILGA